VHSCSDWKSDLQKLQRSVGYVAPSGNLISVVRSAVAQGFKRVIARKNFRPFLKLDIQFMDDDNKTEGASDEGGPTREFFRLLLEEVFNSGIFEGSSTARQLALSTSGM
jgi:hypothetical protein